MAPSQPPPNNSSPHTAPGQSTSSSSTTSPTGTHSTTATTIGKQRSWDEDKFLNLYILDYCRRRKFDETALAFEREAHIPSGSKPKFEAPQGLLFEWWIVFWETFNSQHSPQGQNESGQAYVNTMARLKKLAMHEKDELNRSRTMSMGTPAMTGMSTPALSNVPNPMSAGTMSTMSTPGLANMPNPRPQSQPPQPGGMSQPGMNGPPQPGMGQPGMGPQGGMNGPQPGMNGPQPGPHQPGMSQPPGMGPQGQQRPQPGMNMSMHMNSNLTHRSASTPSPAPTTPQSFQGPPFNPQFSGPGSGQGSFPGQPPQFSSGPGGNQQPFRPGPGPGQGGPPGSVQGQGGPGMGPGQGGPPGMGGPGASMGPGQNGPGQGPNMGPGQNGAFPPGGGPSFPPGSNGPGPGQQSFPPGGPGQPSFQPGSQQSFQPGAAGFAPGSVPGGQGFPPGSGPQGPHFRGAGVPDWGQRPPPMNQPGQAPGGQGDQNRRNEGWEDGRPGPRPGPGVPGIRPGMQPPMDGARHPGMAQFLGRQGGGPMMGGGQPPGMNGPPNMGGPNMGGPHNNMGGPGGPLKDEGPQQQGWSPGDPGMMQRRAGVAAQGGQMGPSGMQGRAFPGQKRPGSPQPPPATNLGNSPSEAKRPRPNEVGPAPLVDSRTGPDGRPTSSKGPGQMQYPSGPPPQMQGQHPGMNSGQPLPQQQRNMHAAEYSKQLRAGLLSQGGPQGPPFGKGTQTNGYNPGAGPARNPRPSDAPSPAAGDGQPGQPGQPRQLVNVKGGMGPPASPSLTHRNVGGVKKSESAGSSPALPPSTVPNGMDSRSRTPSGVQQQMGKPPSPAPMNQPMSRPQSAQPPQGPSMSPVPGPPSSAPPMLPTTQSPSNGMMFKAPGFNHNGLSGPGTLGGPGSEFDFGTDLFGHLTSEFFPEGGDPMLGMEWLNDESTIANE